MKARKKDEKPNPLKSRFLMFTALCLLAIYLVGHFGLGLKTEMVSYSQFKDEIKNGSFSHVTLSPDLIRAKKTDGTKVRELIAIRVEDPSLVPLLEEKKLKYEGIPSSDWLSEFLVSWVLPMIFIFFIWQFFLGKALKGPPGFAAFGKSKAKLFDQGKEKVTFNDVAGCDEAKEELSEIIDFLKVPEKFKEIGGHIPKGVLLVGAPGTGKTLLARAVAGEAGVNFYSLSGSDFVEMFVGVGAARVRDLFQEGQKNAPCIIFIDELDAIAKSRQGNAWQSNDEREQTLNQILVEMDGFDNHNGVIIMAATNRPEVLDPAIVRPGRFDRQIVVERPDKKGREAILKVHTFKIKMEADIDLALIASRTPGFTGADLANIVNEAALLAVRKNLKKVTQICFENAIDRVVAGLQRKSRVISEKEKKIIAVHEVGHAVVATFSEGADPVHRISIVPRSSGALGFTMQIPEEDRHLMSESQLRLMLRVLLGGRAAEWVFFKEVTSGAQDDLRRATGIVKRMIGEFGMGKSLGLLSSSSSGGYLENPFLREDRIQVSEEFSQRADEEMKSILKEEFDQACALIRNQGVIFAKVVERLLEKETLEQDEYDAIVHAT